MSFDAHRGGLIPRKDWEASLEVLYVLNRKKFRPADFDPSRLPGEPAAGVDDIHFHPAEPFPVRAGATRRF